MHRGDIVESVRKENRSLVTASVVLTLLVASVPALNWKYVYNWARGPFPFDSALAASPGSKEFVRAEGVMLPTGVVQESTLRLFRGAIESKSISATYMAMLTGGKFLVVKVPQDFSGRVVDGVLEPLPEQLRAQLPTASADGSADGTSRSFHPYVLKQQGYGYWDSNLFMLVAIPLLPVCLLLTAFTLHRSMKIERHPSMARLAKLGPLAVMTNKVESAFAKGGSGVKAGPFWVHREWIVTLDSTVRIYPTNDLIAVGVLVTETKSGNTIKRQTNLVFWPRGSVFSDKVEVSAEEARVALDAIVRVAPWTLVENATDFETRWSKDQAACEREADQRRSAARQAAAEIKSARPAPNPDQNPAGA